jgi:lipopolysaccharide/colanic/teichoic acid biosynthesis glycosyltransferase
MNAIQRMLDVLLAAFALVVLAPFLLPVMLILRFSGEGDVLYRQERVGLGGRPFGLLKFATMLRNSPNIGSGEITLKNDPRVLPVGRFLRKSKLNELPQLWNILIGDLSVVGPRPMVPRTFAEYPVAAQMDLNMVRPGLSGVGSLVFRDEERWLDSQSDARRFYREVIIPYKASLEQWYVRNRSIAVYLQVIAFTLVALVRPSSDLPWRVWPTLPPLPEALRDAAAVAQPLPGK